MLSNLSLKLNKRFLYLYDFGDDLRYGVKVCAIGEVQEGVKYPLQLGGKGNPPRQYEWHDEVDEGLDGGKDEAQGGCKCCKWHRYPPLPVGIEPNVALQELVPRLRTLLSREEFQDDEDWQDAYIKPNEVDILEQRDLAVALISAPAVAEPRQSTGR